MNAKPFILTLFAAVAILAAPAHAQTDRDRTMCKLSTTLGDISIELDHERAPVSARNFVEYVEAGHFDNLIFHRVIPGFMIQGGGFPKPRKAGATRCSAKSPAACKSSNKSPPNPPAPPAATATCRPKRLSSPKRNADAKRRECINRER